MSTYVDKPFSLIEKKKLQWAKEKEELDSLCAPWALQEVHPNCERSFFKSKYVPKYSMINSEIFRTKDLSTSNSRRSSLPPLYKNNYNSIDKNTNGCANNNGGETSGYGSDNPNQIDLQPIYQNYSFNNNATNSVQSGYESSSSYKDDRPKWKEKTKFWVSCENEPPNWVKRGLQTDEEIVVSNTSPAESPQHEDFGERPYTSTSSSITKTYIRGQNIPLDALELAEREKRRQIALAHQEAIRQQLEEREKRRLEEKQKQIREEREEELRIEREQEMERKRKETEQRLLQEKLEREKKRKEALEEALEIAEKEAKIAKLKQKMQKQAELNKETDKIIIDSNNNCSSNNVDKIIEKSKFDSVQKVNNEEKLTAPSPTNIQILKNQITSELQDKESKQNQTNSPKDNEETTSSSEIHTKDPLPSTSSFQIVSPRQDLAFVLPTASTDNLKTIQYVLMTPLNQPNVPFAIPLTPLATPRTENRVLTPTQFRNKLKSFSDSSTQTDDSLQENNNQKHIKEKLTNVELNYENNRIPKDRSRNRSEERILIEERPKWGANRPPTRYLKQSEKDLLYQRRKLRQKQHYSKNSSDESQNGSPRNSYRKRHARPLWRKNDHQEYFRHNVRMYQTEIVPLESDRENIYWKCDCCCRCNCSRQSRTEILKIESPRERLPDCNNLENNNSSFIIDKLATLHNGLLMRQEHWERSPRTPSLSSSTRHTENNI